MSTNSEFGISEGVLTGVQARRKGAAAEIDYLWIPPGKRGAGAGRDLYQRWERSLPRDIRRVELTPVDYGFGPSDAFWQKMGFSYMYLPAEDPDEEIPRTMVKGVNGNPTPQPIEYDPATDPEFMEELNGLRRRAGLFEDTSR